VPAGSKGKARAYHHGGLRRALLDAALAQIARAGPDEINLRDLARRVGVSHAAPYRHFESREALLLSLAEEGFGELAVALQDAADRGRTPRARLRRAGVAYVLFARANPHHFRLMFGPERPPSRVEGPRAFGILVGLVAACQADGELRSGQPEELARMAWALVHGIAELSVCGQVELRDDARAESFALRAVDALLAGLA
jgi:AcrR family transcriptional regulator